MQPTLPGIHIVATGHYAPEKVITNDDLSHIVDTSDEWIRKRTGIERRHFSEGEKNLDLAVQAARQAIEQSGIDINELGACIVATFSPDYFVPSVACLLQRELGLLEEMPSFDMNAACSGFLYALHTARGILLQSEKRYALVVGSEIISKVLDMEDRGTCILFGDGAGAAVIELAEGKQYVSYLGARGDDTSIVCPNADGVRHIVHMDGSSVFRFAVGTVPVCVNKILEKAGVDKDEIDYYVCHQANKRIIESVAAKLEQPIEKFYMNMQEYGNTSAASVPIALSEMNQAGLFKPGMKVLCVGFGAGLTWAGALIEW